MCSRELRQAHHEIMRSHFTEERCCWFWSSRIYLAMRLWQVPLKNGLYPELSGAKHAFFTLSFCHALTHIFSLEDPPGKNQAHPHVPSGGKIADRWVLDLQKQNCFLISTSKVLIHSDL